MDRRFLNLERRVRLDSSDIESLEEYISLAFRLGKEREALEILSSSLKIDFKNDDDEFLKAKIHIIQEKIEPALRNNYLNFESEENLILWSDAALIGCCPVFNFEFINLSMNKRKTIIGSQFTLQELLEEVESQVSDQYSFNTHLLRIIPLDNRWNLQTRYRFSESSSGGIADFDLYVLYSEGKPRVPLGRHFELITSSMENNFTISNPFLRWIYDSESDL